jgi:uncharacterized membrane protein YozB (DUF420 family)
MTVSDLPAINSTLNGASAVLLAIAYVCIRRRRVKPHAYFIVAALLSSTAFLTCYLIYHYSVPPRSSGLPAGWFKTSYLVMLFSHVVLAIVMLPMIFMALLRTYLRQWDRHKRIARPAFWIWMYVSVTGVLIYVVLYHVVPALYPVANATSAS